MEKFKEGIHGNVSIAGCFVSESKEKKTPFVGIVFEKEDGAIITWNGWLSPKAIERTMQTISDIGFIGKKFADIANPKFAVEQLFNEVDDLTITVEIESFTNDKGEIINTPKIKWVNAGSFGPKKLDHKEAVVVMKGLNIEGKLAKYRKDNNVSLESNRTVVETEVDDDGVETVDGDLFTADSIPF